MGCISLAFTKVFHRNTEAYNGFVLPVVDDKAPGPGAVSRFCLHGNDPIDRILKDEIHPGAVAIAPVMTGCGDYSYEKSPLAA